MFPIWLHGLSIFMLLVAFACATVILIDVLRHPQTMAIMNLVWPVTALFGTVLTVGLYFRYGRDAVKKPGPDESGQDKRHSDENQTPFPVMVAKGALHCGSGCMLGDIAAEWLAFLLPGVAVWLGWHWIFAEKTYAVWILDFLFAFGLGIIFQYFAIVPMRGLAIGEGLLTAVKADTLSLIAWQVGMYGFMAFAQFYLFAEVFGVRAQANMPEFWFAMQLAMMAGFITSYPVNWWLIRSGIKEEM